MKKFMWKLKLKILRLKYKNKYPAYIYPKHRRGLINELRYRHWVKKQIKNRTIFEKTPVIDTDTSYYNPADWM